VGKCHTEKSDKSDRKIRENSLVPRGRGGRREGPLPPLLKKFEIFFLITFMSIVIDIVNCFSIFDICLYLIRIVSKGSFH
jgi:hypothetical protein